MSKNDIGIDSINAPNNVVRRIAVIGIHGVADQLPSATAQSVATLLQHTEIGRYGAFERSSLRLPVVSPSVGSCRSSPDLEFTSELLADTRVPPDEHIYDTIRLSSVRRSEEASPPREVHVFEMYWGDLSRAAKGFSQVFVEFYLLAFQVISTGGETLSQAVAVEPGNRRLSAARGIRHFCEGVLTRWVPILNICILWLALGLLPLAVPAESMPLLNGVLAALVAAGVSAFVWPGRGGKAWAGRLPVILVMAVAFGWLFHRYVEPWQGLAAGGAILALGGLALWKLWSVFDRRWRGAKKTGLVSQLVTILAVGTGVRYTIAAGKLPGEWLPLAVLRGAEWLLTILHFVWIAMFLAQVALAGVSLAARFGRRDDSAILERRRHALWTGEISIFGPILLIVLLNISFWQALNIVLPKVLPAHKMEQVYYAPLKHAPGPVRVIAAAKEAEEARKKDQEAGKSVSSHPFIRAQNEVRTDFYIQQQTQQSGYLLAHAGLLLGLGVLACFWGLLPAILLEVSPQSADASVKLSRWHGLTLNAGYWLMRIGGEIVRWLMVVSTVVAVLALSGAFSPKLNEQLDPTALAKVLQTSLATLGLVLLALFASSGVFGSLAFGFRAVLDVGLDVINWLRRHPSGETTRGRVFARYESLLRQISSYEHRDGRKGYDAIVILAHSQGTVITADVLRYFTANPRLIELPPVHLFTMGSPLRQVYCVRFPHLYQWVREDKGIVSASPRPLPSELGVERWWNTYRSADYVGRHLWVPEATVDPWDSDKKPLLDDGVRREWCLGAGAHTHYWDEHGAEVGRKLDELVASA